LPKAYLRALAWPGIVFSTLIYFSASGQAAPLTPLQTIEANAYKTLSTPVSVEDWRKLKRTADLEFKAEHYRESLKLYKNALAAASRRADQMENESTDEEEFFYRLMNNYAKLANYSKAKSGYLVMVGDDSSKGEQPKPTLSIKALNGMAEIDIIQGFHADAKERLSAAKQMAEKNKLADASTIETGLLLANMLWKEGKATECEKQYLEAISLSEKLGDEGKPALAEAQNGLAKVRSYKGAMKEAKDLAEKSLALRRQSFSEESLEVASSLITLASIKDSANAEEARQLRLKALSIQVECLGTSAHPVVGEALLALADQGLNRPLSQAEYMCLAARHSVDGILEPDSPFIARCLDSLSQIYLGEERLKPATDACQQAIDIETRLCGPRSLLVGSSLKRLAVIKESDAMLRNQNSQTVSCPEAESIIKSAIDIANEQLGPDNIPSASYTATLSWIKRVAGDYSASEALANRALSVLVRSFGTADPLVRSVRNTLLFDYRKQGKISEARVLMAIMLENQIKQTGLESKEVCDLFGTLNTIETQESNAAAAQKHEATAGAPAGPDQPKLMDGATLRIMKLMPVENLGVVSSIKDIEGLMEKDAGTVRKGRAAERLQQTIDESITIYGADSPRLVDSLIQLAQLETAAKQETEAEKIYKRALSIQENGLGADHPCLINVLSPYAAFLRQTGKSKEADELTVRCDSIKAGQTTSPLSQ
jgi:hypothetical protein